MKLVKSLFVATMFAAGAFSAAAQNVEKFYLGVTGYGQNEKPATVDMTVYDNFNFLVSMPVEGEDWVGLNKATIDMRMTNVGTLGVSGTHTYSKLVEPMMGSTLVRLQDWLPNSYGFEGASARITLTDSKETDKFGYTFSPVTQKEVTLSNGTKVTKNVIVGKTKESQARADWHLLTKYVRTYSQDANTQLLLKKGGYIKMGNETMTFTKDAPFFDTPDWTLHTTRLDLYEATEVTTDASMSVEDTYVMTIYMPMGTKLQVGGRVAELMANTTITVDATNALIFSENDGPLNAHLSDLHAYMSGDNADWNKRDFVQNLIGLFDSVVGIVDDAENVDITVNFAPLINGDMDHDGDIEADDVETLADMILGKAVPEVIGETTNGDLYEGEVVNPLSIGDLCRQIDTALGNREKVYITK